MDQSSATEKDSSIYRPVSEGSSANPGKPYLDPKGGLEKAPLDPSTKRMLDEYEDWVRYDCCFSC